jgi:hypothetical protein
MGALELAIGGGGWGGGLIQPLILAESERYLFRRGLLKRKLVKEI